METNSNAALLPTFVVTNYLAAALQGRFAALNILAQLQIPVVDADVAATRERLDLVSRWTSDMWRGELLLSGRAGSEMSFEAKKALEMLREVKSDTSLFVRGVQDALSSRVRENVTSAIESLKFLVAAFGRATYARENYIRGFIEFGKATERSDIVEHYTAHLATASEDVRTTHAMLTTLRDAPAIERGFMEMVWVRCRDLVFIFSTHLHDINQLLASSQGQGLTFESADFAPAEKTAWEGAGLGPVIAGYWRAYEFTPPEAALWCGGNLTDAALACEWRWYGFDFAGSIGWIAHGFSPPLARAWAAAGFEVEEAAQQVAEGVTDPSQVDR